LHGTLYSEITQFFKVYLGYREPRERERPYYRRFDEICVGPIWGKDIIAMSYLLYTLAVVNVVK
jgi:hypothetical protein